MSHVVSYRHKEFQSADRGVSKDRDNPFNFIYSAVRPSFDRSAATFFLFLILSSNVTTITLKSVLSTHIFSKTGGEFSVDTGLIPALPYPALSY